MRNGFGVTALVLGIVSVVFSWLTFLILAVSVPGIVFGVLAVRRVSHGEANNKVMSWWGLILSIAGTAFDVALIAALLLVPSHGTGGPGYFGG